MATSKLDSPVSQTGQSGIFSLKTEEGFKDYCNWDGSSTSLVSSRAYTYPEDENSTDEGVEDERRSSQEGER
jgi:hypothetical protein